MYIFLEGLSSQQDRHGERVAEIKGKPDIDRIVKDVLDTGLGRIAISGNKFATPCVDKG
jgi:hypothetical protein